MSTDGRNDDTAILLLAYGGPDSLDAVEPYLLDVRGGRHTPPELVEEVRKRYEAIGGKSPLREITEDVARVLSSRLGQPVYVGMRHWHPYIRDVVLKMVRDDEIRRVVAICMAPHYSDQSIGVYRKHLEEAISAAGTDVDLRFVSEWPVQSDFIDGLVSSTRSAFDKFESDGIFTVFTAHSLPLQGHQSADPYESQLDQTAGRIADRLQIPTDRWLRCFQSAPRSGARWLGPQLTEVIPKLADRGERELVIVPIGFLCDHVEILYDLDIEALHIARECGVRMERAPMLNCSRSLISALEDLSRTAIASPRDRE